MENKIKAETDFSTFSALDIRIGTVLSAERANTKKKKLTE